MSKVDDEGNWKRRKVANAEEDDEEAEGDEEKGSNEKSEDKEGGDKAEPMETSEAAGDAEAAEGEGAQEKEKEPSKKEEEEEDEEEEDKKETKSKSKKDDESMDESIWSEVDRDIGSLLDAVDGEGEAESLNEDELLNPKQDDSSGKGTRGRNKAIRGGGSVAAKATRGRKKK